MRYFARLAYSMVVIAMASLVLVACAAQQTFGSKLASAYAVNTEVRATAAQALDAGKLSSAEGEQVLRITDQVRGVLDEAADGDERGLALALELLDSLEEYVDGN